MAVNRFVLNGISYHGKGAINEIPSIIEASALKRPLSPPTRTF